MRGAVHPGIPRAAGGVRAAPPGRDPGGDRLPVREAKDIVQPEPRKQAETNRLYEKLIARVALRTLAEAFDVAPAALVGGIVFNGYVSAKDRATGKPVRPLLLSVHAPRDAFAEIVLDEPELDPKACLRGYLNALISPHPYDLEPSSQS